MSQDIRNYFLSSDKKEKELKEQDEESEVIAFKLNQESAKNDPFFAELHPNSDISSHLTNSNSIPLKFFQEKSTENQEQEEESEEITEEENHTVKQIPENKTEIEEEQSKEELKKKLLDKVQKPGKKKQVKSNHSFRKNMFSLKEDLQILDAIKFRGEKSARQVFRDLVVVMNRSDEALKTRYKAYLKKLSEVDKLMMLNKAKTVDSSVHCVLIQKDPKDGKKKIKEIVKNDNAGPPKEKVKPPKQPKSRRSSSRKRVRSRKRTETLETVEVSENNDSLEMMKRNMDEIDNSDIEEEELEEENERDLDPFECKSEINDNEMRIEQGYDSEIILNSEEVDEQNTVSINQTPKTSEKKIFSNIEDENSEQEKEDNDDVAVEIDAKFEIEPASFGNQEKPEVDELMIIHNISSEKKSDKDFIEEVKEIPNPFKTSAEKNNTDLVSDNDNIPTFFKEVERPDFSEKPKSMIERIIEKKEQEREVQQENEDKGEEINEENQNFGLTALEFDDIFHSEGSKIQKEEVKKSNSAEQPKVPKPAVFNNIFSSTGNERVKAPQISSSPEFEKPLPEFPEKELKRSKPNIQNFETEETTKEMKTVAARFRSMKSGSTQSDKEKSADLLYLFIKELSLYFDTDIHSVIKKINRDQDLNLEKLKMQLCHEYIGRRICS